MGDLGTSLKLACEKYISPLVLPHGFSGPKMENGGLYSHAYYIGKKTAVCIEAEQRDQTIYAAMYLLVNGEVPPDRVMNGKKVFAYIGTILSRWPGRVSFEEARKKYAKSNPEAVPTGDWVEDQVMGEAPLFSEYAELILTDKEDIFEDHVKKGGVKF